MKKVNNLKNTNKMAKTPWMKFLGEFYQKHKGKKSYKECMKLAAVEWKKKKASQQNL